MVLSRVVLLGVSWTYILSKTQAATTTICLLPSHYKRTKDTFPIFQLLTNDI